MLNTTTTTRTGVRSPRRARAAAPLAVLIGPPGAGKSTVGRVLAVLTGSDYRDTDADIERLAGKTVPRIFQEDGEARFRALERTAVRCALTTHRGVLALGGGAVGDPGIRTLLAGHRVVFLDVDTRYALARIRSSGNRPLLGDDAAQQWAALMRRRRPWYQQAATVTVGTDGRTAQEVADAVLAELHPGHR